MDPHRFDALVRTLGGGLPRRRLLGRVGGALAGLGTVGGARAGLAQTTTGGEENPDAAGRVVILACEPCFCGESGCACCLVGITGGGVVRTNAGDAQLVLFASRLEEGSTTAAGFVRWVMPDEAGDGGIILESVGPIAYGVPEREGDAGDEEGAREIRGAMSANGDGEHPFVLRLLDAGPKALGQDTAALTVGDDVDEADFGYDDGGPLVGGDLQLLGGVGPIP